MALPGARGSDHIGFTVPNLDEADDFLVNVLGATRVLEQPGFRDEHGETMSVQLGVPARAGIRRFNFYRMGYGSNYEVFEYDVADQAEQVPLNSDVGGHHIGIYVDDIDAAVAYLRDRGIDVMGQIVPSGGGSAGNRWIYFRAPWGLQFELVSFPAGKAYEQDADVLLWNAAQPGD
ncbi:MAG: VOC family protein [Beutenbergiaceae bacterium]